MRRAQEADEHGSSLSHRICLPERKNLLIEIDSHLADFVQLLIEMLTTFPRKICEHVGM
jgi:hypothetical protein